jgi:hypothetical protein
MGVNDIISSINPNSFTLNPKPSTNWHNCCSTGVDWKAVEDFVDMSDSLHKFAHPDGVPSDK